MNSHELNSPSPFKVFSSIYGDMQVGERRSHILIQFQYNNASHDLDDESTGTGNTSNADSMASISSGTGVGKGLLKSHDTVHYQAGHESYALFTTIFGTPETGVNQFAGLIDDVSGYAIGYEGETFGVFKRSNGTDIFYAADATTIEYRVIDKLDGKGISNFNLNTSKMNIYKISFGWLGIAPALFWVYGGFQRGWILFGVLDFTNQLTAPSINNPSLPISMSVLRESGSGSDVVIKTSSWNGGSVLNGADQHIGQRHFTARNNKTMPAGVLTNLLTIRNKTTYQGQPNHIFVEGLLASMSSEGTKPVEIRLLENAALGGTPVWNDKDTENSVIEIDIAGTTVTGGILLPGLALGKTDGDQLPLQNIGAHIHPGASLTVAGISVNASDIAGFLTWHEKF